MEMLDRLLWTYTTEQPHFGAGVPEDTSGAPI
jgi:hypothetical protein